jgi:Subtilisin inhibitor-like
VAAASKVSLDVTFTASANAAAAHYTLRCEPAGGTVSNPAVACAKLLAGTSLFAPRPAHMLCPMIMVGAGRATVTGTYFGKQVHVTITDGGCDLSIWARLKAVFS